MQLNDCQKLTEIPQAIKQYLEEKNTSQAQLARNAGVGEAYVTQILTGKTHIGKTQIKDRYYLDLCQAIGYNVTLQKWRHFNTKNFKKLYAEVDRARQKRVNLVIDGGTGLGKSYFSKTYKKIEPNETYVVICKPAKSKKEFAKSIAAEVGTDTAGSTDTILENIADKLNSLDNAILIIDEFEYIEKRPTYIEVVKGLADSLENRVSLVISGMNITNTLKKYFDRHKHYSKQTASRLGKRVLCNDDITEDITNICLELGIENKNIHKWLKRRVFNFRKLRALLVEALEESEETGDKISTEMLTYLYDGYDWV